MHTPHKGKKQKADLLIKKCAEITGPFMKQISKAADGRKGMIMEKRIHISARIIGANIRRIRLEHGETQHQLGAFLGYGATTIANYESGYRLPDLETFFCIALHYGASLEEFIQDID